MPTSGKLSASQKGFAFILVLLVIGATTILAGIFILGRQKTLEDKPFGFGNDEVNIILSGKNYGWPTIQGDNIQAGMESPITHSGASTWAPAGAAFVNNSLFFGGLRGQTLYELGVSDKTLKEISYNFPMSLKVGIVGLPNVGKSTLFNALLKKRVALSANYPFTTVEPNVGVVAVPDKRLKKLAELVKDEEKMESLPPIVPAVVEFVDIAGLVKGAHQGEGLGNQFLSHIREVDAIVHVLRDFEDPNIVRAGGSVSPKEDKELVETELALADLDKPVLYVYNVSENEYKNRTEKLRLNENELIICAKLEEELADLSEEERKEYLKELGIEETGLERLIKKAYALLSLISFFTTTGKKEVRAWTLRAGETALRAAGVIHTDFEKNFIRAQVIEYERLIEVGSLSQAKVKGWIRTEGKDYKVSDGDVIEFLTGS